MSQTPLTYAFGGGLDTNSTALAVGPGAVIASLNYEPLAEGYGRMEGIERFDGRPAPSDARYWVLPFSGGTNDFAVGEIVTGGTSAATGVVLALDGVTGTWTGSASGNLVLCDVTGSFEKDEALAGASGGAAVAADAAEEDGAADIDTAMAWTALAQAHSRSLIAKVPGQGPVRGVAVHAGSVYAWRDKAGGAQAACYKATAAGWVAHPVLTRLVFTTGTTEILEGQTITGATSGATATAYSVIQPNGSWTSGDAAGFIDMTGLTGTFAVGEAIQVGGVGVAVSDGQGVSDYPPGGRYRTISHNFYGQRDQRRLYGTYGTGPAFELCPEGTVFLNTGTLVDQPYRVFEISNHLGLVFPGGSIQFSGTGEPRSFQVLLGAGEIGLGTEVTDVVQANDTAVAVFGEAKIGILQGRDASDFVLDTLTEEAGAIPDTAQRIARTVYLDARGLRDLTATQAFGNFKVGALSILFENYLRTKQKAGAQVIGSFVCKTKSQYRMMWNDGTGLSVFMGGKTPSAMAFSLGEVRPYCFGQGELSDGEALFFGGEDGYVYRLDKGSTIDGEDLAYFCMTPFNHFGATMREKRVHKLVLEMDAPPKATIGVLAQFDYGDGDKPDSLLSSFDVHGGGAAWDTALWDTFYWSAPMEGFAETPIDGIGRNASFIIAGTALPAEPPHILQAYHVYISPRKLRR